MIEQRLILNDISPDFARDGQARQDFIAQKIDVTVAYLKSYLERCGAAGFVLGISGGVDSFAAGALAARACAETGKRLYLLLLPNGRQPDYQDAVDSMFAIRKICPELICDTVSIEGGYAGVIHDLEKSQRFSGDSVTLGNIQPRLRMTVQYALARGLLVVGTDHAAESVTGFFTKYGDGGTDINPLQELVKDDIYGIAALFGAPAAVLTKPPSAGLGITADDESEMGLRYDDICAYLRGNRIADAARERLEGMYRRTMHKRALPASMKDALCPKREAALVAVDLIHAFIDGGLACQNARAALNNTIAAINGNPDVPVLYVADRHPKNHCSFAGQGGPWPAHAVEGTADAAFPGALYTEVKKTVNTPIERYNVFLKGRGAGEEQYSGFGAANENHGALKGNLPKTVWLAGAATEYCVRETAMDLLAAGHEVMVLADCLAYVDESGHGKALAEMEAAGARIVNR